MLENVTCFIIVLIKVLTKFDKIVIIKKMIIGITKIDVFSPQ